ncbi:hypothetical protein EKK58_05155 [Candidatus Dependentiae bacterium]|nr:MAG: hypothetical protein EKK58_05155 [Candidatus Dependentiae bacterium]
MVNDALKAAQKIEEALKKAGYRVVRKTETALDVYEPGIVSTFRGTLHIGQWVEQTRLVTKRIGKIAMEAAEGC